MIVICNLDKSLRFKKNPCSSIMIYPNAIFKEFNFKSNGGYKSSSDPVWKPCFDSHAVPRIAIEFVIVKPRNIEESLDAVRVMNLSITLANNPASTRLTCHISTTAVRKMVKLRDICAVTITDRNYDTFLINIGRERGAWKSSKQIYRYSFAVIRRDLPALIPSESEKLIRRSTRDRRENQLNL